MKRLNLFVLAFLIVLAGRAQQAKYVFYFIGDGMGMNQVNLTEMYRAAVNDRIGIEPLLFASFPVMGAAYTFSQSNPITDSAAGGTALACGQKTYNGAIGVGPDKKPLHSIAYAAKEAGARVGILTTVSIDHATPAAFYAHQPSRQMYYEIASELPKSGFDYFAGSGFLKPAKSADGKEQPNIVPIIEQSGYTVCRGLSDYEAKKAKASKILLINPADRSQESLPYAIDHKEGDMKLSDLVECGIEQLMRKGGKGFFMMAEGGQIDWASHSNDAATMVRETEDFDEAIRVAYNFYLKHPKQTLIVISADHETGGLGLGNSDYMLYLKRLASQQCSIDELSRRMSQLRKEKNNNVTWDEMRTFLGEQMGFWRTLQPTWEQERALRDEFERSFVQNKTAYAQSLYSKTESLADVARRVMRDMAHLGWTTGNHTAEYVPVFAIGAGSERFSGKMNNTDIARRMAKVAGWKL